MYLITPLPVGKGQSKTVLLFGLVHGSLLVRLTTCSDKLHGHTVHQQYQTLYFPTDAHNVKKRTVIKTL